MSKNKDIINTALVIIVGMLAIFAASGGVQADSWIQYLLLSAGAALLGGALVRVTLFPDARQSHASPLPESPFKVFKRNADLGSAFWIEFISGIGNDVEPLWFVGRRHLLWIDVSHDYRNAVAQGLCARMNTFANRETDDGRVTIIVSNEGAFDEWREFLSTEIVSHVDAATAKRLIRLGLTDDGMIRYSAVGHRRAIVVTTLLSTGSSADSPTFVVEADSNIGNLYRGDFERVADKIDADSWWTPG